MSVFFWTMKTEGNGQTVEHCRWTPNIHKYISIAPVGGAPVAGYSARLDSFRASSLFPKTCGDYNPNKSWLFFVRHTEIKFGLYLRWLSKLVRSRKRDSRSRQFERRVGFGQWTVDAGDSESPQWCRQRPVKLGREFLLLLLVSLWGRSWGFYSVLKLASQVDERMGSIISPTQVGVRMGSIPSILRSFSHGGGWMNCVFVYQTAKHDYGWICIRQNGESRFFSFYLATGSFSLSDFEYNSHLLSVFAFRFTVLSIFTCLLTIIGYLQALILRL